MSPTARIAPGPREIFAAFREDPVKTMLQVSRDYGDVARMKLSAETYLVTDPEHIKQVLNGHNDFVRNTAFAQSLRVAIGNGLLISNGSFWLRQRRIVQPGFSRDRIASFAAIMSSAGEQLVEKWAHNATDGTPLDLLPEFTALTLRVLGLCLFDKDLTFAADELSEAVRIVCNHTAARVLSLAYAHKTPNDPNNAEFLEASAVVRRLAQAMILERRRQSGEHDDTLSMLIEARDPETGEAMSDVEIGDELMHFITAGHETTTVAFCWTCVLLAQHPEVVARVREELALVLGSTGRTPTFADMAKLPLLRACVEESLRLYPPVWGFGRRVLKDEVIGDYHIPAGAMIALSPYVTHHDARFWKDPEAFLPERFLTPDPARPRYAYFPFGGGAHLCVGMHFALLELTTVLACLIQRFRFEVLPEPVLAWYPAIALRPRYGIAMRVHGWDQKGASGA